MQLSSFTPLLLLAGIGTIATLPHSAAAQADRKDATQATRSTNDTLYQQLPFSDTSDFDNAHKGFVAPLPAGIIKGEAGNLIWDPDKYAFIKEGVKAPDTVNPSLWRESQLINISGLFKVTDGIYQVRDQDLSNMTIIEGKAGITVVDPMISEENREGRHRSVLQEQR